MSNKPKLAIVGRPNVGKSSLFNRICKKRMAIVDEAEGITRDRLYAEADCFGKEFEVIDTGGINPRSQVPFNEQIMRQAEIAIEEADGLILAVDAHTGITDLDHEVARVLLHTNKPVTVAVNKIDHLGQIDLVHEFYGLGFEHCVGVSAEQNFQIAELLESIVSRLSSPIEKEEELDTSIKVAIIGRPNVGKSTLTNYLLDEERCLVSPIPGTTRDSVDVRVSHDDEIYTFIDTAGIRRKGAEHEAVDKFAAIRTQRAIERCDICLLMVDAQQGITAQEKRIAKMIEKEGKCCIVLLNKWDLVKGFRMEHCFREIEEEIHFLRYCPKIILSAETGRNVEKIFPTIREVRQESLKRVSTGELNKFVEEAIRQNHPPMIRGKRLRIYYLAQVSTEPPTFVLFINHQDLMAESWRKYLINQFRKVYRFTGAPLVFYTKSKPKESKKRGTHSQTALGEA
ncbi:ribosome biogenesis GTPase Der [Waddlia chondrophila]|uniref:GTPase Der n=1 Tax=Waddlia chondrophila (strain ATCC VR-1470 / WSU 86-1044) TaxID=716544 RepID=D6YSC6_WADCW|nr:ribosome biogenesis GTPase Der [Waddlia chondrophila]ADI38971.1 GTP-binding protein EngA [Waddlia chondrophila WSU 86-1044]